MGDLEDINMGGLFSKGKLGHRVTELSSEVDQEKKKIAAASIDMDNSIKDNLGKVKEHLHENEEQLQSIKDNQTIGSSFDSTRENQKKAEQAIKKEIDQERKDDENNASSST